MQSLPSHLLFHYKMFFASVNLITHWDKNETVVIKKHPFGTIWNNTWLLLTWSEKQFFPISLEKKKQKPNQQVIYVEMGIFAILNFI